MESADSSYEIVVLGATGYTGKLVAEHITTALPTDVKWALAGRNAQKLKSLTEHLKNLNSDRKQPGKSFLFLWLYSRSITVRS